MYYEENPLKDSTRSLVFIHGWGGNECSLLPVARQFQTRYSCYRLALAGFGRSELTHDYQIEDYLADIESFISEKKLDHVVLIGHSFGGKLALMLKRKHPEYDVVAIAPSVMANPFSLRIFLKIRLYKLLKRCSLPIPSFLRGSRDYRNSGVLQKTFLAVHHRYLTDRELDELSGGLIICFKEDKEVSYRTMRRLLDAHPQFCHCILPGGHFAYLENLFAVCHAIQCYLLEDFR